MAIMKIRVGNAWVNTTRKGAVRYGGATIPYGPAVVGQSESVVYPLAPTATNANDGTQTYNMGIRFFLNTAKNGLGVRWRVPDSILAPQGPDGHVVSIWNIATETRVAFKAFTPVPGGYQDILFDAPVALSASPTEYIAAVYTRSYVARTTTDSVVSPSGNLTVSGGKLVPYNGGANIFPDGNFGSWYYVSPIVSV